MAVLHRALFTWFVLLVFLILLVLRLDQRIQWNWFIVFIPVWFYDSILMIYVFVNMMSYCRIGHDRISITNSIKRKLVYLVTMILKMTSLVLLCLKLECPSYHISIAYIMLPLWVLVPFTLSDVTFSLVRSNGYL